jgi:hypothetical protein
MAIEVLDTVYALGLAIFLIAAAVLVHYQALRVLTVWQQNRHKSAHARILVIIFGLIAAHIVEAAIFALGYWLGERGFDLGSFVGTRAMDIRNYFYFSFEAYTTQGIGDVYPIGALRLIASLEPLAGLILIGWSTSFTFVMMGRDWREQTARRP